MERLPGILRDPLIHFLLAGAALFALAGLFGSGDERSRDERTIVVDRAAMLNYLQYRNSAFEPGYFAEAFDSMPQVEKQQLVDSYVREEAIVREARALGLDDVDYVIRQRLAQKILFIAESSAANEVQPSEEELKAFFAANADLYRNEEALTFTHVFIDNEVSHRGGGLAEARRIKAKLEASAAGFNDAPQYGDRFAFLQNYVGRTPEFVANQFGAGFVAELTKLKPSSTWQGPIQSDYGWHLVLLTNREAARQPALDELRDQVVSDYVDQKTAEYREASLQELMGQYTIRIENLPGIKSPADRDD